MRFSPPVRSIVIALCVSLCGVASAVAAAKRVVDPDGQGSPTNCQASAAAYTTIGVAIAASSPGDSIYICPGPGPYNEQLIVNKNLKFIGILGATIQPSPMAANTTSLTSGFPIAPVILVEAGFTVTIDQLTIDGSGHGISVCDANPMGVYFRNGSGTVSNSVVRNIRLSAGYGGCQAGNAIFAQSSVVGASTVTVKDSTVHDFQKNGITGNGVNTTLIATGNRVTGDGPTPAIAQNGIQIGFSAQGTVSGNVVSGVVYSLCVDPSDPAPGNPCNNGSSTGILVYQAGGVTNVTQNSVITTQTGVYLDASGSSASQNDITHTLQYDGIYLTAAATGNTVALNSIGTSDESAIWVDGTGNFINKNKLIEAPVGIHAACGNSIGTGSNKNSFFDIFTTTDEEVCKASVNVSSEWARVHTSPVE